MSPKPFKTLPYVCNILEISRGLLDAKAKEDLKKVDKVQLMQDNSQFPRFQASYSLTLRVLWFEVWLENHVNHDMAHLVDGSDYI